MICITFHFHDAGNPWLWAALYSVFPYIVGCIIFYLLSADTRNRKDDQMKVLILSATTGGGHMTAANAMKNYILSQNKDAIIKIEDTLQYVSPFLNKAVTGGYVYMARNTPKFYGSVYMSADKCRELCQHNQFKW